MAVVGGEPTCCGLIRGIWARRLAELMTVGHPRTKGGQHRVGRVGACRRTDCGQLMPLTKTPALGGLDYWHPDGYHSGNGRLATGIQTASGPHAEI